MFWGGGVSGCVEYSRNKKIRYCPIPARFIPPPGKKEEKKSTRHDDDDD